MMQRKTLITLLTLLMLTVTTLAQERIISGTVKSEEGVTLPGATVRVASSQIGTTTDMNGKYKIRIPNNRSKLIFSFVGYQSQQKKVKDKKTINVTLKQESQEIKEVVCVGYGGVKSKESLVGSVDQVDAENLQSQRPVESVDKMLGGMMAGVRINNNSGDPGKPVEIRIRGQNSLKQITGNAMVASSEPLIVLDGVPLYDVSAPNEANDMVQEKVNPLAMINPEDIKSITVLKDASASAIYGANASNGVIIIQTKDGKKGKTKFNFSSHMGFSQPLNHFQFLNTDQYVTLAKEAMMNAGYSEQDAMDQIGPTNVYTDWFDEVSRMGITNKNNLSFSGGKAGMNYRFSASYFDMRSIGKGNNMDRITTRLNLTADLSEKLQWNFILGVSSMKKDVFNAFQSISFRPNISPYKPDGSYNDNPPFDNLMNPLAGLAQNENWVKNFYTNGSTKLRYQILPSLKLSSTFGVDYNTKETYLFYSEKNAMGRKRGGYIARLNKNNLKWISFTQADYNLTIQEDHNLEALVGFQLENRDELVLKGTNADIPFEKIKELGISETENSKTRSNNSTFGTVSYYGRMSYNFKNTYHLSMNYRSDAASVFGGDQRRENFASIGASWVISREPWMEKLENVNLLKIRGSYGNTGNSRIGTYAAHGLYQYSDRYGYGGELGAQPFQPPNKHLTWEKNHKFNFAIDLGLYDCINISLERYINTTRGAITNMNVPLESGFTSIPVNAADMRNSGWEFSIRNQIIQKENWKWSLNFNVAANSNKILDLGNDQNFIAASSYNSAGLIIGEEVSSILALRYAGVNPENGEAQYYLNDGSITEDPDLANRPENRVIVGQSSPDLHGGLNTTLKYKNWTLSSMLSYEYGGNMMLPYNAFRFNSDGAQILIHNQSVNQMDRWQEPGDQTDIPRLSLDNVPVKNTTRNLFDRTHIHFRNISLSYRLPDKWVEKLKLDMLRINANVDNLGYWYKSDSNPSRNGIAEYRYTYPVSRTFTLGLNVKF